MPSLVETDLRPQVTSFKTEVLTALNKLRLNHPELVLYGAGYPSYSSKTFARDSIISALISDDISFLEGTLVLAASTQATEKNPMDGAQLGCIYHEIDPFTKEGVYINGRSTKYNASDATSLFSIGHEFNLKRGGNPELSKKQRRNIENGVTYILNHLESDLFVEDPKHCGADRFALSVTYWKDSSLPKRLEGQPVYPVVYPLAHIQNLAGLRSGAYLLGEKDLLIIADKMKNAIPRIFNKETGNFPVAIDCLGMVEGISSDGLHALFYISPGDITQEMVKQIICSSKVLETRAGYRTLDPTTAKDMGDGYHARTVWTHEQAIIHKGAVKHLRWAREIGDNDLEKDLIHVMEVSSRITDSFSENGFPELFEVRQDEIIPGGCDPQLWAIAARIYFDAIKQQEHPGEPI